MAKQQGRPVADSEPAVIVAEECAVEPSLQDGQEVPDAGLPAAVVLAEEGAPTAGQVVVGDEGHMTVAAAASDPPPSSPSLSGEPVDLFVVTVVLPEGVLAFGDVDASLRVLAEVCVAHPPSLVYR